MTYTTIRGAEKHSAEDQRHIDRAADMLHKYPGLWGGFDEEALRGSLTHSSEESVAAILAERRVRKNVLIVSNEAVAVLLGAGTADQKLKMLCVEEEARGQGIGSALLQHIISIYTADHLMELNCPPARENFYKRHGFHTLVTAAGKFPYMAGPGESRSDVLDRLPEGNIYKDTCSQPLESFWWTCPECGEDSAPTRDWCSCGYTKTT